MKDVAVYLEEDIRLDMDSLSDMDFSIFEACAPHSRKTQNIYTLIKYLKNERHL